MIKWLKNISFSLIGKIIAMILWLCFDIMAVRVLSVKEYAEWAFFYSILTMCFYFGWLGINSSTKVNISHENPVILKNSIYTSLIIRLACSIFLVIAMIIIMPRVSYILGYPEKYENLRSLLLILPVIVFFNSITEYNKELFMGVESFLNVFIVTVTEFAGFFIFGYVMLKMRNDNIGLAYACLIGEMFSALVGVCLILSNYPLERKIVIDKKLVSKIIKYAIPIAFLSWGGLILMEMDTFMLGVLSDAQNISSYSIAKNICAKATHVNYALTVGVMTSFAVIEEDYSHKKKMFRKASYMNIMTAFAVAACLYIMANMLIFILYGSKYPNAGRLIRILTIYYILYAISNYYNSFLDFRNKAGTRCIFYLSVIVINLVFNYLWIPTYGADGAAMATILSLVPYTIMVILQTNHEWNLTENRNNIL